MGNIEPTQGPRIGPVITGHKHQVQRTERGRFVMRACAICGQPNDRHLSYGQEIAEKLGGDPLDYVTGAPTELPAAARWPAGAPPTLEDRAMAFDRPDAPGRDPESPQFDQKAHLGDLLVLQVQKAERGVDTQYGAADVITADVFVIDPAGTIAAQYQDAWLFGTVLFSQLREKKGRSVLGVLEQGEKKPGKNPPWRLADPTDAQESAALRAMASKPGAADPEPERQPEPAAAGRAPWE